MGRGAGTTAWSGAIAPDAWRAEVVLSRLRLGAAVVGFLQVSLSPDGLDGPLKTVALVVLGLFACGSAWLATRATAPGTWEPRRVMHATLAVDGAIITLLTTVMAGAPTQRAWVIPVLLPIVGGLKLGPRGAAAGSALMLAGHGVGAALRSQVHGLPVDIPTIVAFAGMGIVSGIMAGWVALLAARERERAESATRHLEALHEVIMAGIGGGEREVAGRMAMTIARRLGYPGIGIALLDGAGELRSAAAHGLGFDDGEPIPLDEDGPALALLGGAPAMLFGPAAVSRITLRRDGATSAILSSLRVQDEPVGILVVVSDAAPFTTDDLGLVDRMADQMGLVIEAARAFDREADLVERYRELDRMRAEFVSLTSHELRTPVTAIVGIAETLLHREISDPDKTRELAGAVVRQGRRLERLVDDLRTLTVLDQGGLRIITEACDLATVVAVPVEASSVEVTSVDGPDDVRVLADADRVVQILGNLLDNAAQHGGGRAALRWWREADAVVLEVSDEGPGIPPERRERVFARFETSANLLAHRRGTGLGLPLSRDLARAMDGDLVLIPSPTGATFRLTLPWATAIESAGDVAASA